MFRKLGTGIIGGVSMVCTCKYLKDQKKEKKDMEKEIKTYRRENDYLRKKIDKLEDTDCISDKERREDNIKFMNNFDTLMESINENRDVREKKFKRVEKKINRTIERNRKTVDKLLNEFNLD